MTAQSHHKYEEELRVALDAVRDAARLCQSVQSKIAPNTLQKKDRSPVTIADFGSQAIICRALGDAFSSDPIIAEENSAALQTPENASLLEAMMTHLAEIKPDATKKTACSWIDRGCASEFSKRFWALDPIDGTKGFLRGEQYAIALGLIVDGTIEVAVLGCPNLAVNPASPSVSGVMFSAIKGHGTFQHSLEGNSDPVKVSVSDVENTTLIRFCESVEAAHSSHEDAAAIAKHLGIVASPVRIDSQAKYAVVARGEGEAYLRLPRSNEYREKIWDHAGGTLIVTEAGGRVTDITGAPLDFTHGTTLAMNKGVIVSNGTAHDAILKAIADLGVGA